MTGTAGPLGGAGTAVQQLEPNIALVVVIVWLLAAPTIAAVYVERTEVTS